MKRKFIAIIPARGGSKRLPNKNIKSMNGKPLIAWTIEAALNSISIDDVVVSTDIKKIAGIALSYGAEVPFLRPKKYASDTANSFSVILHCINYLRSIGREYENVILLQPTSPLRTHKHIEKAIELYNKKNANAVFSICLSNISPIWISSIGTDLSISNLIYNLKINRIENEYYRLNGAIYICNIKEMIKRNTLFIEENVFGFIMSKEDSIDIDDEIDFQVASIIFENRNKQRYEE